MPRTLARGIGLRTTGGVDEKIERGDPVLIGDTNQKGCRECGKIRRWGIIGGGSNELGSLEFRSYVVPRRTAEANPSWAAKLASP